MVVKGLVNLITPAYNSASFIFRLLDSVLSQTYPMIKMYVVDDGSTDNTQEVIEGYMPLFAKKGYELEYIYQENAGQSSAINNALKLVDGEFLLWPDSDDWYKQPDAIEKLVAALKNTGDEVGVARCRYEFVAENTFQTIQIISFPNYGIPENILEDVVYGKNGFGWTPGGYIVKIKFLDRFIPNRNIHTEKEGGQNMQLMLPYIINSKCVSIEDVSFCYLVRADSHSRAKGFEIEKGRVEAACRNWVDVFDSISDEENRLKLEGYKMHGLSELYYWLLRIDVEHEATRSFHRHIKECKELSIPLTKRYRRMGWWTTLFSVKSYSMISKCHSSLSDLMFNQHNNK